ncbi:MAG: hypothetical protein R3A43_04940 [Bacteroidia bacterium]
MKRNISNLITVLLLICCLVLGYKLWNGKKQFNDFGKLNEHLLKFKEAKKMGGHYYRNIYQNFDSISLPNGMKPDYSLFAQYDISLLEDYLQYVKTTAKSKGYNPDNLAIRLYHGMYPEGFVNNVKANKTTIFLAPILKNSSQSDKKATGSLFVQKAYAQSPTEQPTDSEPQPDDLEMEEIDVLDFAALPPPPLPNNINIYSNQE